MMASRITFLSFWEEKFFDTEVSPFAVKDRDPKLLDEEEDMDWTAETDVMIDLLSDLDVIATW